MGKNPRASAGDPRDGMDPGSGRPPGGGPSHPLEYLPGESTDGGAWGRQSTGSQRVGHD